MVEGTWLGMMNLIELLVGFDLVVICIKVKVVGDGSYLVSGMKIFIIWGENDCVENIIYFVLVCLLDVLVGLKGILLFIVLKFLVNDDGFLGVCNDLICVFIEYKMGIYGSLIVVMFFGEKEGVVGYLVGEENKGIGYMFMMMNYVCVNVGLEGVGIVECVYQYVLWYV